MRWMTRAMMIGGAGWLAGCAGMGVGVGEGASLGPVEVLVAQIEAEQGPLSDQARAFEASVDLDGDGTSERLVYVRDPSLCGTGGCALTIMEWRDGRWQRGQVIGPVELPVYLSDEWDGEVVIGVTVAGGGMQERIMALYPAPEGYPSNPTVPPAVWWRDDPGEVLIAEGSGRAVR
ncbi:hypothetical protein [Sphingomicrobium arenosum]|uniref:hypothetical protein n=1 Tax=Sphingomicrobium arenosum TaxID=2233861 RepID=UPI0022406793|nr:hypothetical protein [Sphingomicrobium arenosum]